MDAGWQNYPADANPADAAIGQTSYDNHLYYSFGVGRAPVPHCCLY